MSRTREARRQKKRLGVLSENGAEEVREEEGRKG